ncbi:MAG: MauE/DoxX family redox-associated membrane protein [Gammaproteobacteria bacterium]|nr:MAG: MauE/DoxX family redox-associated membrane protein [Gammaproteobacteria bacterium]
MESFLGLLVRVALAALLAAAGIGKLRDRRRFDGTVLDYRLLPPRLALRLAAPLPWVELALGVGLLAGVRQAGLAAALLFGVYGVAMAVNLARGRRLIDCGCGDEPQRLNGWLVLRNVLLAAAALLAG